MEGQERTELRIYRGKICEHVTYISKLAAIYLCARKTIKKSQQSLEEIYTPIIPARWEQRKEDSEFEASLGYIVIRSQFQLLRETLSQK